MNEKIKLAKCSIFLVILFQIYLWFTNDYIHTLSLADDKSPIVLPAVRKKAILLISRYRKQFNNIVVKDDMRNILNIFSLRTVFRGGSSFTGNIFNKQKDLVYYFEPFALYGYGDGKFMNDKTKLINQMLNCNPPLYDTAPRDNNLNETFVADDIR